MMPLDYFAVDVLFAALVLCLMIAVTCTLGNPSTLQHKEGFIYSSLLLTGNNKLMLKADFCGCVAPHPRLLLAVWRVLCTHIRDY